MTHDHVTVNVSVLFSQAEKIGDRLRSLKLRSDLPIGILLRSQHDQTLHYLAALSVGLVPAVLTPPNRKLNPAYYLETTSAVLGRCGFSALITDVEGLDLPATQLSPHTLDLLDSGPGSFPSAESLEGIAFVQFSSGTTGMKRGVAVSSRAVVAQLETYSAALSLTREDVILSWLPLYHDMGFIACLHMPLAFGVSCVMIDPIDWVTQPALFPRMASDFGATLSWNPNFSYSFMGERIRDEDIEGVDLSSIRGLINCSEPVTLTSQRRFFERFSPVGLRDNVFWGCYAMAESTFALTHGTPTHSDHLDCVGPTDGTVLGESCQVSVGHPLPGVEIKVISSEGSELHDREVGELCVRSPFNFMRYYNDPEATTEAHADGHYRTGDLGYRVGNAYYVVGRKKDVMIIAGSNIFPQDIEDVVANVAGVAPGRVSVFSRFDDHAQTERVTILYESDVSDEWLGHVTVAIRQRVAAAFALTAFETHRVSPGWLVKSSSGKMARSANRRKWLDASTAMPRVPQASDHGRRLRRVRHA